MESSHFESLYPDNTRYAEIEKILSYIKEGNSCQIVSVPGVGRSNILGLLSYNRKVRKKHLGEGQKWFHFVLANFSEIRKRPLFDATKFLFISLIDSLRERNMEKEYQTINHIFKESLTLNDELVLFQGLKRSVDFLAIEKELTIVFLFDRFEDYIPMLTPEFFSNLKVLRNRAKYRFSAVFSLQRPLEDTVEPVLTADFYEFIAGHIIYLPLFDKPGFDFRLSYLEKITGKTINQDLKKKLLEETGGHGKLTRLCAEALLTKDNQKQESSSNTASFLLSQRAVRGAVFEIWHSLTPSEQHLLITRANRLIMDEDIKNQEHLNLVGIVKNGKIAIPLLKTFIKEQIKTQQEKSKFNQDVIQFDPNTNEIKKGEAVLSNKLTSSEHKLLGYLLEHSGKVMGREDIIANVWQETRSTAGVTDQALDQLIFRLRKKIEEDPNNPTHLQTIKGRGFRLIP